MIPGDQPKIPVLFLFMEFAPVNTTGNFRGLKFIKYISQYNIQPIVVTFIEEEGAKYFNAKIDTKLLSDIPGDCILYRIHCSDRSKFIIQKLADFMTIYFSIKDSLAKRWKSDLFKGLVDIMEKHKPKMLVTSLPPFSSGKLAMQISKKFRIPYILDMRDLWAHFGHGPLPSYFHYKLTIREENIIFRNASAIIGVTPQLINILKASHPGIEDRKFYYIPNGFDTPLNGNDSFQFRASKDKLIIGYVGSFYFEPEKRENMFRPFWKKRGLEIIEYIPVKQDWLYRSPYFFFKALRQAFDIMPVLENMVRIEFVGKKPLWLDNMLDEFALKTIFHSHGFVSHRESLDLQEGFDMLLATSEKIIDAEHYCLPSKVFDYVNQQKPILAFVTEGIQKEFIETSGLGVVCNPDDTLGSAEKLINLIRDGREFVSNQEYLKRFQRSFLAGQLAELIHFTVQENSLIIK